MGIFRLYSGDDGESHMEELDLASHPELTAPSGARSGTHKIRSAKDRSASNCQSETRECSHSRSVPDRFVWFLARSVSVGTFP